MNTIYKECWFSVEFFFSVSLLYLHNTLITTNFDVLKYIKKIFKISIQCIFNAEQKTTSKKSIENLNSFINMQLIFFYWLLFFIYYRQIVILMPNLWFYFWVNIPLEKQHSLNICLELLIQVSDSPTSNSTSIIHIWNCSHKLCNLY